MIVHGVNAESVIIGVFALCLYALPIAVLIWFVIKVRRIERLLEELVARKDREA